MTSLKKIIAEIKKAQKRLKNAFKGLNDFEQSLLQTVEQIAKEATHEQTATLQALQVKLTNTLQAKGFSDVPVIKGIQFSAGDVVKWYGAVYTKEATFKFTIYVVKTGLELKVYYVQN